MGNGEGRRAGCLVHHYQRKDQECAGQHNREADNDVHQNDK